MDQCISLLDFSPLSFFTVYNLCPFGRRKCDKYTTINAWHINYDTKEASMQKKEKENGPVYAKYSKLVFFVSGFSSINKFRDKTSMLNKLNNKLISPTPCSESVFRLISNPLWNLGLRLIEISVVPIGETKQIIPASHLVWCDGHWRRLSTLWISQLIYPRAGQIPTALLH